MSWDKKTQQKGFSLIEVLVTISIVTVIMTTVLFNYGSFTDRLALTSAAQEMAVVVRQSQTYGLSVKEVSALPGGSGNFQSAYGVTFSTTDPSNYYLFADVSTSSPNTNKVYNVGSGCGSGLATECIEKFTMRNGVVISGICNGSSCTPSGSFNAMHVTFLRPNPDANIYFTNSGTITAGPANTGRVILTSPRGSIVEVYIENTGQVSIES